MIAMIILAGANVFCDSPMLPYPVQKTDMDPVSFSLKAKEIERGTCSLRWDDKSFIINLRVFDDTPMSLKSTGLKVDEMYRADSVEFWIDRHQFGIAEISEKPLLYDYLYQNKVQDVDGSWTYDKDGYQVLIKIPWRAIAIDGKPDQSFQFALQINDRKTIKAGEAWKNVVEQTLYPQGAIWDRPSTYGTIFLNQKLPAAKCASSPLPFAKLDIRQRAYEKRVDALVRRLKPFGQCELILKTMTPDGKLYRKLVIPSGLGEQVIQLPWDETRSGIFRASLFLVSDKLEFGPISEYYFNAGETSIADYKSSRSKPKDLETFWSQKLKDMRGKPFNAKKIKIESPWKNAIVDKFQIDNHRGNPMFVYITRHKEDKDAVLPNYLNVYPPMKSDQPKRAMKGYNTLTFCGSLQGEAKLPDQTKNESLWARAESLDDCYWLDVVLDGVRALDFLASKDISNGDAIVTGGSRGGWYTLALASTAPDRVSYARFTSPCYSDVTMNMKLGYSSAASEIYQRFERDRLLTNGRVFENFRYFDPLFLATMIKTPVFFSAGLQDHICSAIGMTAAANNISYDKACFILDAEGGHGGSPYAGKISSIMEKNLSHTKKDSK